MTILSTLRRLKDYLTVTFPDDVTTGLTIQTVQHHTVVLNINPGNADPNAWYGALLQITSGASNRYTVPIVGNVGQTLYIATPFSKDIIDTLTGATVSVLGGPLKDAKVFFTQPPSVQSLIDTGTKYFVYVYNIQSKIAFRGLGRSPASHGSRNSSRSYLCQVMCEVPYIKGGTTAEYAYESQTKIFDLTEQVMALMHGFRSELNNNYSGESDIQVDFGLLEDTNGKPKSEMAILETELTFNTT